MLITRTDKILVLRAKMNIRKTLRWDGSNWQKFSPKEFPNQFNATVREIEGLADILNLIEEAENDPHITLVRGLLVDGLLTAKNIRRLLTDQDDGDKATIARAATTLVTLDIDKMKPEPGLILDDSDAVIAYVLRQLPEWLQKASCAWQFSAGYAIDGTICMHLFFLSEVDASTEALKALLDEAKHQLGPVLDLSTLDYAHLVYLAPPRCIGAPNLVPVRYGIRKGERERVDLGNLLAELPQRILHSGNSSPANLAYVGLSAEKVLARIGDPPLITDGEGFFGPIQSAVGKEVARLGPDIDQEALRTRIEAIVRERWTLCRPDKAGLTHRLQDIPKLITHTVRKERLKTAPFDDPPGLFRATMTADEAEASLHPLIEAFFAAAEAYTVDRHRRLLAGWRDDGQWRYFSPALARPDISLIAGDLGLGKTRLALQAARHFVRDQLKPPFTRRIFIRVNDHKLGAEIAARLNADNPGIASVWRGLDAEDPGRPGTAMCRRGKDKDLWLSSAGAIGDLCKNCPFNRKSSDPCSYVSQNCNTPVIILAGPSALTHAPPGRLRRRLTIGDRVRGLPPADILIVDETQPTSMHGGVDTDDRLVAEAGLASGRLRPPKKLKTGTTKWSDVKWAFFDQEIVRIDNLIQGIVSELDHGEQRHLTYGEIRQVMPEARQWRELRKTILRLVAKLDPEIGRKSGDAFVDAVTSLGAWNRRILTLAKLCEVAAQGLSEPDRADAEALPLITAVNGGAKDTGLRLRWRSEIARAWQNIPTLILDATASPELLRRFWPDLQVLSDARIKVPEHVTVHQIGDRLFGYRDSVPKPVVRKSRKNARNDPERRDRSQEILNRATQNLTRISSLIDVLHNRIRPVGVIGPKDAIAALEKAWLHFANGKKREQGTGKPGSVITGWFNNIRGSDAFRDVSALLVISRPSVPPQVAEDIAEVLFCRTIERLPKGRWYDRPGAKGGAFYTMRKGFCRPAPRAERHPDPHAELIRAQIADAEIEQAFGRARALRRTAANPLWVIILTALPSSRIEVDDLVTLDHVLCFDEIDALRARGVRIEISRASRGGLRLLSKILGKSPGALRKQAERTNGYNNSPYRRLSVVSGHNVT